MILPSSLVFPHQEGRPRWSRSLSDIDRSTAANDARPSASFSARKNPQRIPGFSRPAASHLAAPPSPRHERNVGQAPRCGRRTRPFSGRAFREHRTNVGVLPIFFIVGALRARRMVACSLSTLSPSSSSSSVRADCRSRLGRRRRSCPPPPCPERLRQRRCRFGPVRCCPRHRYRTASRYR